MGNWNNPLVTSLYTDFVTEARARDDDVAQMFLNAPSNQPIGSVRAVRVVEAGILVYKFEEWDGAVWFGKPIAVAGGGTGHYTAAGARTNLGIGTMGTQAASAVAITGGDVLDVNVRIKTGGAITFQTDNNADIGTFAAQVRKLYVKTAFVVPVGVDKYTTS